MSCATKPLRDPIRGLESNVFGDGGDGLRVRAAFISDAHIGNRHSDAESLLDFLDSHLPQTLYLVGDFLDGWELRRRWRWKEDYSRVLRRLIRLADSGVRIRYAPGNHDAFLRDFLADLGVVEIADEFVHETVRHGRILILHGDQFDKVELCAKWLSRLGSAAYDLLLYANGKINAVGSVVGMDARAFGPWLKWKVKQVARFVSDYERVVVEHAREKGCDGVVCGHGHTPTIARIDGILYCNAGDWVENRTGITETSDGAIRLVHGGAAGSVARLRANASLPGSVPCFETV